MADASKEETGGQASTASLLQKPPFARTTLVKDHAKSPGLRLAKIRSISFCGPDICGELMNKLQELVEKSVQHSWRFLSSVYADQL